MNVRRSALLIFYATMILMAFNGSGVLAGKSQSASEKKIIVYYFHGTYRCHTCLQIEKFTGNAVKNIQKENPQLVIELKVINRDLPENSDYVKKYGLEFQSVIIAEYKGNIHVRWKDCDRIWDYYTDEKAFMNYLCNELNDFMN